MASVQDFTDVLNRISAAIAQLQANSGSLNTSQEDSVLSDLQSKATQLEALANPQSNP